MAIGFPCGGWVMQPSSQPVSRAPASAFIVALWRAACKRARQEKTSTAWTMTQLSTRKAVVPACRFRRSSCWENRAENDRAKGKRLPAVVADEVVTRKKAAADGESTRSSGAATGGGERWKTDTRQKANVCGKVASHRCGSSFRVTVVGHRQERGKMLPAPRRCCRWCNESWSCC